MSKKAKYYVRNSTYVVDAERERRRTKVWKDLHYVPSASPTERGKKPTRCVETGQVFESAAAAARAIGCAHSSVKNAIHYGQSLMGLHWEFVNPNELVDKAITKESNGPKVGRRQTLPVPIKEMTPEQLKEYRRNYYNKNKEKFQKNRKSAVIHTNDLNWFSKLLVRFAVFIDKTLFEED